jgi:hypothetical protein
MRTLYYGQYEGGEGNRQAQVQTLRGMIKRGALDVLFTVVGAHRKQRGANDHRQENYRENEIVNHVWTSCGTAPRGCL